MTEQDPFGEDLHRPVNWFTQGTYPSCSCGFAPEDNIALNKHWKDHGISYVAVGNTIRLTSPEGATTSAHDPFGEDLHRRAHEQYPFNMALAACWEQGYRTALADLRSLIEADPEHAADIVARRNP